jgi:hypothetical protein
VTRVYQADDGWTSKDNSFSNLVISATYRRLGKYSIILKINTGKWHNKFVEKLKEQTYPVNLFTEHFYKSHAINDFCLRK